MSKLFNATAIDAEIGDWLIVDTDNNVARRITGVEVHSSRGDELRDGEVRIRMGALEMTCRHDKPVYIFKVKELLR